MKDVKWLSVFCWACGEENKMPFSSPNRYNKNMVEGSCPACGHVIYIRTDDFLEVKDRRERRGIPR